MLQSTTCQTVSSVVSRAISFSIDGLLSFKKNFEDQDNIKNAYMAAADLILNRSGRLIIVGVGKSGHIAKKIAATISSTGTPAYYIHPTEASHGDLGMISNDDTVLCLSWSGESIELLPLFNFVSRFNIPLIAISSSNSSTLAKFANISIILPKVSEACPHRLAPTTSSTLQLVAGDALALLLLEIKGFTKEMFLNNHPGGKLGASLVKLKDFIRNNQCLPTISPDMIMSEAIIVMSKFGRGMAVVVDEAGHVVGVITDGDLRRHMHNNLLSLTADLVMNKYPKTINQGSLAGHALRLMDEFKITNLVVVDDKNVPIGVIYMHDLLNIGLV